MDKKFVNIDKQKIYFKVFNIVCIGLICSIVILLALSKLLPRWFTDVCFYVWLAFFVFYVVADIIFYLKIKKNIKNALRSKYLFNRETLPEQIKTAYKDCILQEVEFFEDGFTLNNVKTPYDDVKMEYSIYGDNIMFHIYVKDEETNPLLVFIVTEEMYYMIKRFNLNLSMLNKEIDILNIHRGI